MVTLYLNEQKMLETPAYGDLDNDAKQLLDSIKGQDGLFIDDCQVQHLDISRVDVPHGAHFEIQIRSGPDDFLPEPLKLYEIPDGLYYPISAQLWTQSGLIEANDESVRFMTDALAAMTNTKISLRHQAHRKEPRNLRVPVWRALLTNSHGVSSEPCRRLCIRTDK